MTKRALVIPTLATAAIALTGCGSSSKAPGVQTAPSSGATEAAVTTTAKPPAAISKKPTVTVPTGPAPTKLVTKDLVTGTGQTAKAGDTVTVNYVGVLYKNGKEFDSSWSRNQPFTTALSNGSVIPGWVQGIPGMKVGGRRELVIPASLAYGKQGSPPTIPPNSPLVFVVDLLSVSSSS
jgi:FKBP-type peptidyl-prolyl cis-trans isomerase